MRMGVFLLLFVGAGALESSRQRRLYSAALDLKGGASDDAGYYKALGCARDATPDEVKRAYRRAATKCHPDKGGDEEAFKRVGEAYSVISDPTKRRNYDRFGRAGVENQPPPQSSSPGGSRGPPGQGGADASSAQHMFEQMFGGLGGAFGDAFGSSFFSANAGRQPRRFSMSVSLEDLYAGRTIVVAIGNQRARVRIEPGLSEGDVIRSTLGGETIVFELRESPHAVFARSRADLYVEAAIALVDALGGSPRVSIRRLDGSTLRCALAPPGVVLRPGCVRVIEGEGMPIRSSQQHPSTAAKKRGRLFVRVSVTFPRGPVDLDARQQDSLRALLKPSTRTTPPSTDEDEANVVTAREAEPDEAPTEASDTGSRRSRGRDGGSPLRFAFR